MMCMDSRCQHERFVARYGHEVGMYVHGDVSIGEGTMLCAPIDFNGKSSAISIGRNCDIAAFVSITCADSHLRCIGASPEISRAPITIGDSVFIGQGAIILGGTFIGNGSVIGAGVVLGDVSVPPYSRVSAPRPTIDAGWYALTDAQREARKNVANMLRALRPDWF